MTPILKKQFTALCGMAVLGGALLWSTGTLRAQEEGPSEGSSRRPLGITTARIPMTRDAAAKNFVALMEMLGDPAGRYAMQDPDPAMMSSFSRSSESDALGILLSKMAQQWKQPNQTVKVESEDTNTATVTVQPSTEPVSRPLILIREGDSWGVDVLATYAKWNGTEGESAEQTLARLTGTFERSRQNARRSSCQSNLKQVMLGVLQYTQDYDEKYPPAKEWVDVLQPYLKSEQIFHCPEVTDPKGWGYAFNSKLSQKPMALVPSTSEMVSVYETSILKKNAYGTGENLAFRHIGGANYAFADGHVKWLSKERTPSFGFKK